MQSCPLPIELCESVMDEIPSCSFFLAPVERYALIACMLTCQTWADRASYILRRWRVLNSENTVKLFTAALRNSPGRYLGFVNSIRLGDEGLSMSQTVGLITTPLPNLRSLSLVRIRVDLSPRVLRMFRLSFFAGLTTLECTECSFDTLRTMLYLVWGCPSLQKLILQNYRIADGPLTPERAARLSAAGRHLRGCSKLHELYLIFPDTLSLPPGDVFGSCLKTLQISFQDSERRENLVHLLRGAFPDLENVIINGFWDTKAPYIALSTLHILAAGLSSPHTIKKVAIWICFRYGIDDDVAGDGRGWCERMVGRIGEWDSRPLRSLLTGLQDLEIWVQCGVGQRQREACVAYILSVLPDVRDILSVWLPSAGKIYPSADTTSGQSTSRTPPDDSTSDTVPPLMSQ
ncbi:hypothetical protein C8Q79DRAFT_144149 [Trametes meyenii]|nr:hypothetical protein C8Q79DRAFT_144149 [Trametes meyenii]